MVIVKPYDYIVLDFFFLKEEIYVIDNFFHAMEIRKITLTWGIFSNYENMIFFFPLVSYG